MLLTAIQVAESFINEGRAGIHEFDIESSFPSGLSGDTSMTLGLIADTKRVTHASTIRQWRW